MSSKYYYLIIIPILSFVVVVGLGLFYKDRLIKPNTTSQAQQEDNGPMPYVYPEDENQQSDQSADEKLLAAIGNFRSAQSLRIKLTQKVSEGTLTGAIEYVKPLRLHAQFSMPNQQALEAIIVGGTVYIKLQDNVWDMTDNSFLKSFSKDFFTSMLIAEPTLESFSVPKDSAISTSEDRGKKCTNYQTKYTSADGLYDISFCVNSSNQIQSITKQTKDGDVVMEYSDYNALFNIERPVMPLLTPELPRATSTN